jgi:hypothetical protein
VKSRLPNFDSILPVFAVIAFMVYGWTLVVFLWKLPSWILYLTLGEIFVVLAYSLTAALLESLTALAVLLLISALLPSEWLREVFVVRGTIASLVGLGAVMLYMNRYAAIGYDFINVLIPWSLAGLGLTVLAAFLAGRNRFLVRTAAWLADQLTVFVYLFVPASLVSLLVVLYRNIF